jgi:hypothetical protein
MQHVANCLQESDRQTKLRRANPDVVVFSSAHIVDFTKPEYDVSFNGFIRSLKQKFSLSPKELFEPYKQHTLSDDVLYLPSKPAANLGIRHLPTLGSLAVQALVSQVSKYPKRYVPFAQSLLQLVLMTSVSYVQQ